MCNMNNIRKREGGREKQKVEQCNWREKQWDIREWCEQAGFGRF